MPSLGGLCFAISILLYYVITPLVLNNKYNSGDVLVDELQCPKLFSVINDVAKEAGCPMPYKVFLNTGYKVGVSFQGQITHQHILHLGVGLLQFLNVGELKAIIAHEYGHISQKDDKLTSKIGKLYNICKTLIESSVIENRRTSLAKKWYYSLSNTILNVILSDLLTSFTEIEKKYLAISKDFEFMADTFACNVAGDVALTSALYKLLYLKEPKKKYDNVIKNLLEKDIVCENYWDAFKLFIKLETGIAPFDFNIINHKISISKESRLTIQRNLSSHPSITDRITQISKYRKEVFIDKTHSIALVTPDLLQKVADMHINHVKQTITYSLDSHVNKTFKNHEFEQYCKDYFVTSDHSIYAEELGIPLNYDSHISSEHMASPFNVENELLLKEWSAARQDYDNLQKLSNNIRYTTDESYTIIYNGSLYNSCELDLVLKMHIDYMKDKLERVKRLGNEIISFLYTKHNTKEISNLFKIRDSISRILPHLSRLLCEATELHNTESAILVNNLTMHIRYSEKLYVINEFYSLLDKLDLEYLQSFCQKRKAHGMREAKLNKLIFLSKNKIKYGIDIFNDIINANQLFIVIKEQVQKEISNYIQLAISNTSPKTSDLMQIKDCWDSTIEIVTLKEKIRKTIAKNYIEGGHKTLNQLFGDNPSELEINEYNNFYSRICGFYIDFKDKEDELAYIEENKDTDKIDTIKKIAYIYLYGSFINKDYEESLRWFAKGKELKDAESIYRLGEAYYYGNGVTKDYQKAYEHFKESIITDANDEAFLSMGLCYYEGNGAPRNYKRAFYLFQRSALMGNSEAMYWLSHMYIYALGVSYDSAAAYIWFRRAYDNGSLLAKQNSEEFYWGDDNIKRLLIMMNNIGPTILWDEKEHHYGSCFVIDFFKYNPKIHLFYNDNEIYNWVFSKEEKMENMYETILKDINNKDGEMKVSESGDVFYLHTVLETFD